MGENGYGVKEETVELEKLSLSGIKIKSVPHISDYIPSSQLKTVTNPLATKNPYYHPTDSFYISPSSDILLKQSLYDLTDHPENRQPPAYGYAYHRSGPRKLIYFDPENIRAAIVTCGGLCPGTNTVIRELVVGLSDLYGVHHIFGIKAGFRGFYTSEPVPLTPKMVDPWHKQGGTGLQTSRGGFDLVKIVDSIVRHGFSHVYIVGGDGTMRGAVEIYDEVVRRKLPVAVAGIPKTVDNDVGIIDVSFGFHTAVETAQQAIDAGHVEAESAVNGIGLVKLMGRSTGHIALHATLSNRDVDCCLIPENDFFLHGKGGLFEYIEQRLTLNGHAVVVVAEGAGQDLIPRLDEEDKRVDESGNPVLLDVGKWLKSELFKWWKTDHPGELFTVKYIDPTYMVRAVPANATDNMYCTLLAHSAIHGAMAGYTGFVAGRVNGNYAYIPVKEVAHTKSAVDTMDHKWAWVRSVTNQPDFQRS